MFTFNGSPSGPLLASNNHDYTSNAAGRDLYSRVGDRVKHGEAHSVLSARKRVRTPTSDVFYVCNVTWIGDQGEIQGRLAHHPLADLSV